MYLLDTALVSEQAKPDPDRNVTEWLARQPDSSLYLSAVTVAEIWRGIELLPASRRRTRLEEWANLLEERLQANIVPFGRNEARSWARLAATSDRRGQRLPPIDAMIAATALVHGLTVVTPNVRDFERCGVPVLNPMSG